MSVWKVWFPDDCDESEAEEQHVFDGGDFENSVAESLAETFYEEAGGSRDLDPTTEVMARAPSGKLFRVTLTSSYTVSFHGKAEEV